MKLPKKFEQSLELYLMHGIPPGSFLMSVLCNDLKEACAHADDESRYQLFDIVYHLYNHVPGGCWGSKESVSEWLTMSEGQRKQILDIRETML